MDSRLAAVFELMATSTTTAGTLKRQLGLAATTTMVVGEVIAVGLFPTTGGNGQVVLLLLPGGRNPKQALLGVVLIALGAPVYRLVFAPAERK